MKSPTERRAAWVTRYIETGERPRWHRNLEWIYYALAFLFLAVGLIVVIGGYGRGGESMWPALGALGSFVTALLLWMSVGRLRGEVEAVQSIRTIPMPSRFQPLPQVMQMSSQQAPQLMQMTTQQFASPLSTVQQKLSSPMQQVFSDPHGYDDDQ